MSRPALRSAVASTSRLVSGKPLVVPAQRHASSSPSSKKGSSSKSASSKSAAPANFQVPEFQVGRTHVPRYEQHYTSALAPDLMYMAYNHRLARSPPPEKVEPVFKNAYEVNRPVPWGKARANPTRITAETVPKLESVHLHIFVKEAVTDKLRLLTAIQALRVLSGQTPRGGNSPSKGVQIIKAKKSAAKWKLRQGMAIGAKVELRGAAMYEFTQSLIDFVLPRLRDFEGLPIPPASRSVNSLSAHSGVVSFGLPPLAMSLFPQLERNLDAYRQTHGFHLYFKSNVKGAGAEDITRALMSGFKLPFYRK